MENKDIETIKKLVAAIYYVFDKPGKMYARSFFSGIAYGLGTTIGVALVLAMLVYILRYIGGLPVIGDWLRGVSQAIPVKALKL
jgi:hypothetical protein